MSSLRKILDRLWVGIGFASRYGCLSLMLLYSVLISVWAIRGGLLAHNPWFVALPLLFAAAILAWLVRPAKHYRTWGVIGLAFGASMATSPCWFPEFPAQDFPASGFADQRFPYTLMEIHAAETRFHAQFGRYGELTEIRRLDGYRFQGTRDYWIKIAPGRDTYQLTAWPLGSESGYACCIGCPHQRFFYSDETGVVRFNSHCRPADAHSSVLTLKPFR